MAQFTTHGYSSYEPSEEDPMARENAIEHIMNDKDLSYNDAVEYYEQLLREIN